jgi:hypothetical protein
MFCTLSQNISDANENRLSFPFFLTLSASIGTKPTAAEILLSHRTGNDLTRSEKKILKHEFVKQVKSYVTEKAKGNDELALKIFLTILTLAAAVGVGFLIAGLACSLSCSGLGGLAVLVAVFGLGGIIFGSVKMIKAISKISGKNQAPLVSPPPGITP